MQRQYLHLGILHMYDLPSLRSIASRLSFRHLNVLVVVGETGSLHKAANQLGITQSGLSRALQEIEETFGGPLFVRSVKGVSTNIIGRTIIDYAKVARQDLQQLHLRLSATLEGGGGYLAIGSIVGGLHGITIRAVDALLQLEPSLFIVLKEGTSLELLDLVEDGSIDFAVCRISMSLSPQKFDFEPLFPENLSIVVSNGHPLVGVESPTWTDLYKYRWLLFPSNLPIYSLLQQEFRQVGLPMPEYRTETSSPFVTLLMLKQCKDVVTAMSAETANFCVEHGIAVKIPIDLKMKYENFGVVTRKEYSKNPAAIKLIGILRQYSRMEDKIS